MLMLIRVAQAISGRAFLTMLLQLFCTIDKCAFAAFFLPVMLDISPLPLFLVLAPSPPVLLK